MICLTGDIHHSSLKTGNQQHCEITEIQVTQKYLRSLESREIKVTFFISGKCFAEEWNDVKVLCDHPLVEVGGHTFNCFAPELPYRIWNKLTGNYNGPAWAQHRDARKTIDLIREKTGKTIGVWRNHMYMHGPNTERILAECGIKVCSDGVKRAGNGLEPHPSGIFNFPLNIIPDHEHLYHAERTPEWVADWIERYDWSDDYGSDSYFVDEWTDIVLEGLKHRESLGIVSNMIIHPITLYLCDRFRSLNRILDYISQCETCHMSELMDRSVGSTT